MASALPTLEPTHDAEGDFADDDDGDFEDAIGEPEDSSPPLVGPPPSPPHPTPPRSAPPSAIATPDPSSRVTASGTSGSPPTASIHEAGEPLVVASPAQDNEPVRDPQDEEVTQLHIEHSDDEEQEVEVESEAEEEESRTPTAASPTRTSMTPQEPPSIPSGAFDYSRTSEWETSLPPTPSSASTSYLSAEKTAPQPSPKPPAARSNRFSISSLSAPPDTPTAFTSVSEHFSASPSTDVSDGTSPSISSAVWRNSAMGNGKALVEVSLGDDDGRDSSGDEVSLDGKGAVGSASLHGSEASGSGSAKANGKRSADASDVQEEKKDEVNFLLQRLESQNSMLEIDPKAKRLSIEENSKLRDSFIRMQQESAQDSTIDWDFWGAVMSNYEHVASTQPRELSRAIQQGIPPALRGMTWQLMSASKDLNLEAMYSDLLKQTSPHEKSIGRDLNRTFPKHEYFKDSAGVGQNNLYNVVKAYSLYDDEVGYTQGLQFIVGPLLLNMPDEEAFCVLVRLMKSYDLRSHYTPNMPGLQLRLFQFDRLIEELLPGVFMHLLRQGVKSSMYASQWFLTLFGYRFPLELVSCVFDLVFAEGVEAIFRFSVAILKRNEAKICELEFEHLLEYLKNGLFEAYAPDFDDPRPDPLYKADQFIQESLQVKITPLMLDQFSEEWENLCRQQNAHTAEIENLRRANAQLSAQVRGLESSLSQINIEHCELVRQVVMAKIEREELEDELVKYKIAYADLSHQQEFDGAQTSRRSQERSSRGSISSATG